MQRKWSRIPGSLKLPRSLRMIEGFGIHSFRLINEAGRSTFVKFHWRPKLGLQSTIWDETVKIAGADPDFYRCDLSESIEVGNYPEWELAVQLFTDDEAAGFPFDHLDSTKLVPQELVPLQIIGKMLDKFEGRVVGILIAAGADGQTIKSLQKSVMASGAKVKLVAPKIGKVKLSDGSTIDIDGQLAGTPSVMFDAVTVILAEAAAKILVKEGAAIDFVRNAFGHLKAIAVDTGGRSLLANAGLEPDEGVVDAGDAEKFITLAKTRQWEREPMVRTRA